MTRNSCLYVGSVMHRRLHPRVHRFRYRAFWLLLDLDELDELSGRLRLLSYNRSGLFSFFDSDHGDESDASLRVHVERLLAKAAVDFPGGRIRLLCMPRTLGYCFNPLSIFFCDRADGTLAAVIYQVHNTFGERHSYVIRVAKQGNALRQRSQKQFYVSPFLAMDMRYDFRISGPDERISVGVCTSSSSGPVLNAILAGARQDLTDRNLMLTFLMIPAITIKVILAIHWEALRLWMKGVRLHRRPSPPRQAATVVVAPPAISD